MPPEMRVSELLWCQVSFKCKYADLTMDILLPLSASISLQGQLIDCWRVNVPLVSSALSLTLSLPALLAAQTHTVK